MNNLPLDHVAIESRDMDSDIDFYTRLGFRIETRYRDWAMMRDALGRGIALLEPGGPHPPHLAFRAGSSAEVSQIAGQFNSEVSEHRDGSVSVYFDDPSGNSIEVIFYPEKSE